MQCGRVVADKVEVVYSVAELWWQIEKSERLVLVEACCRDALCPVWLAFKGCCALRFVHGHCIGGLAGKPHFRLCSQIVREATEESNGNT